MGRLVSKRELSEILGVSERTLTDWQQKGMPIKVHTTRGLANEYDTADVFRWRENFVASGERRLSPREEKEMAQAELYKLQFAEKAGMFLLADDYQWGMENMILAARSEFMRVPRLLKKYLKKHYDVDVELESLQDFIRPVLAKLAEHESDGEDEEADGAQEVATA